MAQRIIFTDNSNLREGQERNGGGYGFTETAVVENGKIISGKYSTTCDSFEYCPNCGEFYTQDIHQDFCIEYKPSWVMTQIVKGGTPPIFEEDNVGYTIEEISAAAALGSMRSPKKAQSSRENGKRGGRPRKS